MIVAAMVMPVGSRVTPSGFQAKPVKAVARRYSEAIQQAAKRRVKVRALVPTPLRLGGIAAKSRFPSRLREGKVVESHHVLSVAKPG